MAFTLQNSFEMGSDGLAISAANSGSTGNNAFNSIDTDGGGPAPVYDNAQFAHGGLSALVGNKCDFGWDSSIPAATKTIYGRTYFRFSGTLSSTQPIVRGMSQSAANTLFTMRLATNSKINNLVAAGTVKASAVLSANTWYRIEWKMVLVTSGTCTFDATVYVGDSTTAFSVIPQATGTSTSSDTEIDGMYFGATSAPGVSIWFDDVQVNDSAFPGPVSSSSATAPGTVSFTGSATGHIVQRGSAAGTIAITGSGVALSRGFRNNAEGGTNSTTVTTGNSGGASGDAFTAVSGTPTFSSTQAAHGTLSYALSASTMQLSWTTAAVTDGYGRAYVYLAASGASVEIIGLLAGSAKWHILFGTPSFLINNATFTTEATGTAPTTGQWYRLEWHHNSASQLEVKVWNSMDSSGAPNQDITASASTNSNIDEIFFFPNGTGFQSYVDDLVGFASAFPGPVGSLAPAIGAASGLITFTGLAAGTAHDHLFTGAAASSIAFTGAATGQTTFHSLHNDFESGQTTGTTITTGNSGVGGDNPFDVVTGAVKYSNVVVHNGSLSALMLPAAASSVNWGAASLGSHPVLIYGRVYMNMSAIPTGGSAFMQISGDQHANILRVTESSPGGTFKVVASDGTTTSTTNGTIPITLNQWVRIEWQASFSAGTAVIAYQLFNNPESLTPSESISVSRAVTDTFFTNVQVGPSSSPTPAVIYLDDLALSNNATPGPSGSLVSGTASSIITFTGSATGHITEHGSAVGTIAFTGAAGSHITAHGSASSTITIAGQAASHITQHGSGASTITFTGAAVGSATRHVFMGWASDHHDLGTSITAAQTTDSNYEPAVLNNFTAISPEYEMEWGQVEPSQNTFTFTNMDTIAAFAVANNLALTGHTLIWDGDGNPAMMPTWVTGGSWTRDTLLAVLQNHITTVVTRYSSVIHAWNVVNEALEDDGTRTSWVFQNIIGDDWIEKAFQYAHAADPTAKLFYNDYGIDWGFFGGNAKYTAALAMFTDFVSRGIPIHGVGIQGHYDLQFTDYPDPTDIADIMQTYRALGLEVRVTELDCRIDNVTDPMPTRLTNQATVYQHAETALQNAGGLSLTVWGVSDATNWLGTTAAAAPFDVSYVPKAAWTPIKNFAKTHIGIAAGTATDHLFTGTAASSITFTGSATGLTRGGIGNPVLIGTASPGSNITSVPITTTATVPPGAKILLAYQGGNRASTSTHISSASDANTNGYVVDIVHNNSANCGVSIASADNASSLASGSTITITTDALTGTSDHVWAYYVTGLTAGHATTTKADHGASTTSPLDTGASAAVTGSVLNFAVTSLNGSDTMVAGSGYTLLNQVTATKSGGTEFQVATGQVGATQDAQATQTGTASSWAIAMAVYQGVSVGEVDGSAGGNIVFTGSAVGRALQHGTAASAIAFTGTAIGRAQKKGVAASTITFTGSATGSFIAHVSTTDTASGADSSIKALVFPGTDSASGADASVQKVKQPRTDTGSGADASTLKTANARTDSATGIDSSLGGIHYKLSTTDSGSGTDAHAFNLQHTESGTGTDMSTRTTTNESSILHANEPRTDSATGTDTSTISQTVISVVDTGHGADVSTSHVIKSTTDAATGADASILKAQPSVTDTASGSDSSTKRVSVSVVDSAHTTDISALIADNGNKNFTTSDAAHGAEVSASGANILAASSGTATDSRVYVAQVQRVDSGSTSDARTFHVSFSRTDSATGTDQATFRRAALDSGQGADVHIYHASITVISSAVGIDRSTVTGRPANVIVPIELITEFDTALPIRASVTPDRKPVQISTVVEFDYAGGITPLVTDTPEPWYDEGRDELIGV